MFETSILMLKENFGFGLALKTAFSMSFLGLMSRIRIHEIPIKRIPPTYSPTTNCQPKKMEMIIPNSMTRLVDANRKAMEDTKLAPFLKMDFVPAKAEKLHELLIKPKNVPKSTLLPSFSPIVFCIFFSVTKICIILLMI